MATYSRSQTTSQTTQTSTVQPSMDISSLLVKTMENVMNDKEEFNDDEQDINLETHITNAINNSDLIKNNNKNNENKELLDLLKDKTNTNKENLNGLLKNNNNDGKLLSKGVLTPIHNTAEKIKYNARNEGFNGLLKDKGKINNDEENLNGLLKDKSKINNDEENLNGLLKDRNYNAPNNYEQLISKGINNSELVKNNNSKNKDSKTEKDKDKGTVKSKSDNIAGKIISGGIIASTIAGIMGSKGIIGGVKGAASGALTGTGKVAGGLVSKAGDIGGGAIAGISKLFGPVSAMIGKTVGTAVAVPFKVVGGTITAAIGGLGKLINMPLKELVTKGTLIAGVLSQLFVFLEGLMAKFISQKDVKWIDFMSKLKSSISIIPDKIKLSLEHILSKVHLVNPFTGTEYSIFGSITQAEKKELKGLEEDGNLEYYFKAQKDLEEKRNALDIIKERISTEAGAAAGLQGIDTDFDASQFDLSSEEGRQLLRNAFMSNVAENSKGHYENVLNDLLKDYDKAADDVDTQEMYMQYLENQGEDREKIQRYNELKQKNDTPMTEESYREQQQALENEQQERYQEFLAQGLYDLSNKQVKDENGNIVTRGLTQAEQDYVTENYDANVIAAVKDMHAAKNTEFITKDATGAERFLQNQYKQWTDSWSKMFKDFKQDIGINISQKQEIPNPLITGQ